MNSEYHFSEDGLVVYKGVKLNLTRENVQDYRFQTGMNPIDLVEYLYNNSLQVVRDNKINKILDEE
jgi:hypothetical protein